MSNYHRIRRVFLLVFLLIINFSCYRQKGGELIPSLPPPDLHLQFFQPLSEELEVDYPNYLQLNIRSSSMQFSSFGHFDAQNLPTLPRSFYFANEETNEEVVVILDDDGRPAFLYNIDAGMGTKSESLVEFEPIATGGFYLRLYYYDWDSRIGTLLFESEIQRNGTDFVSIPIFETENLELVGIIKSGAKMGNQSFAGPISRLDDLENSPPVVTRGGFLSDIENAINNFSTDEIIDYATSHLNAVRVGGVVTGLIGLGLSELAVGATAVAAGPILTAAGLGIAAVALTVEVVLKHQRIMDALTSARDKLVGLGNKVVSTATSTLESIRGYRSQLSEVWNEIPIGFDTLEDLLDKFDEEEILVPDEELDDLPDSDGVVHIALSWDTDETDIDLWVIDPSGEQIYYDNPNAASGGYLDRDDTDGIGPENIYWRKGAPNGMYQVKAHYYGCETSTCPRTTVVVQISDGLGYVNTIQRVLSHVDDIVLVDIFTKNDKTIE